MADKAPHQICFAARKIVAPTGDVLTSVSPTETRLDSVAAPPTAGHEKIPSPAAPLEDLAPTTRPPGTAAEPSRNPKRQSGFAKTVGGLTTVNGAIFLAALLTGPLQAHALGPTGRGEVAEVLVPISIAGVVGEFGLGVFAQREVARGRSGGVLLGTVGAIMFVIGLIVALGAHPLALVLVGHRQPVEKLLTLGLVLLPLGLLGNLAGGMCAGLQKWGAYSLSRIIPSVGAALAMLILFLSGSLSVETAVVLSFVLGGAALIPLLLSLRNEGRLRFDRSVAREGLRFGGKAWLGTLIGAATSQIGLLLMIGIAGPRQVGLYAVAANVAGSTDMLSTSVYGAIFPRIAVGEHDLAARASRMTILFVGSVSLVAALAAPFVVPLVFGGAFTAAVPMVELLLIVTVTSAASTVMAAALTSAGRPGVLTISDGLGLTLTVPALVLLLPVLGGVGAALGTACASTVVLGYLLFWCNRTFAIPARHFILVRRSDIAWAWSHVRPYVRRLPMRSSARLAALRARA